MNGMPGLQCLLNKLAAFDDSSEVSAVALKQAKIPIRIAVDDQQVGKGIRDDLAEPTGLPDDLGIDERRRPDDFLRTHNLGANEKLAAVIVLKLSQEVTAKAYLDALRRARVRRRPASSTTEFLSRLYAVPFYEHLDAVDQCIPPWIEDAAAMEEIRSAHWASLPFIMHAGLSRTGFLSFMLFQ